VICFGFKVDVRVRIYESVDWPRVETNELFMFLLSKEYISSLAG
jgi:two-component SAPR family response regulator